MVVRAYDLPSRHLFRADLHWAGRWIVSKPPLALRDGGRRVDDGLVDAIEAAAPVLQSRLKAELLGAWEERFARSERIAHETRRRATLEIAGLRKRRRALLDDACRFEWEARRALRRTAFPIEKAVAARVGKERRRVRCVLDPRAVSLTLSIEGEAEGVTFDAFGAATGGGIPIDEARRLARSAVRRAFESQPSLFDAIDLAWQAEDCERRIERIEFECAASAGALLQARATLAECTGGQAVEQDLGRASGIAWSAASAVDGNTLRLVAHDLDRSCQVNALVELLDGRWVAKVVDVRAFDGDGTPVRSDDAGLASAVEGVAAGYAAERREDLLRADRELERRRELKRRTAELEAWGRIERMRETEAEMIARVRELMAEALKGGRPATEFPNSWFFAGSHVELRVQASADSPRVNVVVERPVEFSHAGVVEELRPAILFTLDGDVEVENADWHRIDAGGHGWNLWATHMRRDAIAAVAAVIVRSKVGMEIEAGLLARAAKALQVERHALRDEWGLAESAA